MLVVLGLVPVPGVPGRPDVPGRPVLVVGVPVPALAGEPELAGAFVLELVGVLGLVPAVPAPFGPVPGVMPDVPGMEPVRSAEPVLRPVPKAPAPTTRFVCGRDSRFSWGLWWGLFQWLG